MPPSTFDVRRLRALLEEQARALIDARSLRALSPAIVPVCLLPWLWLPVHRELDAVLFRDASMSQYTGWCIRHGVKLYKDVGAPDGPVVHFLHAFFQMFVGITDAGCRKADFVFQVIVSAAMGAALAPRFACSRAVLVLQRGVWATLAATVWLSYYLSLGSQQTVQRDPYYALLGYLGMVLVFVSAEYAGRPGRALAFAGGFLTTAMIFSRPFGVAYPAVTALALLLELRRPPPVSWRPRARAAAAGAAAAVVVVLGAVAMVGSLSGLWFWYVRMPLVAHRFIGRQSPMELLSDPHHYRSASEVAITILIGLTVAMASGVLPWRAIGFALAPILFLFSACWTGKGWGNHVIQTIAAYDFVLLLALSRIWSHRAERRWSTVQGFVALATIAYTAQHSHAELASSELSDKNFKSSLEKDAVDTADYLKTHTRHDDRVFLFAHEAHTLLFAERATAIPYYVNMIFDIQSFMEHQPPEAGQEPDAAHREEFNRLQRAIAADGCGRLGASLPAAMVFMDNSLGTWGVPDGVTDVAKLCPDVRSWLLQSYTLGATIGGYHVYMRNDRTP